MSRKVVHLFLLTISSIQVYHLRLARLPVCHIARSCGRSVVAALRESGASWIATSTTAQTTLFTFSLWDALHFHPSSVYSFCREGRPADGKRPAVTIRYSPKTYRSISGVNTDTERRVLDHVTTRDGRFTIQGLTTCTARPEGYRVSCAAGSVETASLKNAKSLVGHFASGARLDTVQDWRAARAIASR